MWIIKEFNDPGPDYGWFQVGYFEPIGGDHIFRGIGPKYDSFSMHRAEERVNFLNGGSAKWALDAFFDGVTEITDQLSRIHRSLR